MTEQTKPSETTAKEGEKTAEGPPEKYDFKAPEGVELDAKTIEAVTPIFKELGLTQEQASKLVDFQMAREAESAKATQTLVDEMRSGWRNEVVKAADLGNGTDNLKPEVRQNISKVFDAIGDAKAVTAFKEALDLTGVGDHPAVIRGLNAVGKLLSEGTLVRGGNPSPLGQAAPGKAPVSAASALYPNLKSSSGA